MFATGFINNFYETKLIPYYSSNYEKCKYINKIKLINAIYNQNATECT